MAVSPSLASPAALGAVVDVVTEGVGLASGAEAQPPHKPRHIRPIFVAFIKCSWSNHKAKTLNAEYVLN